MLYFTYITIVYHVPSGLIAYLILFAVVVGGGLHTRSTVILRDYTVPGIYMRQIDNVPWLVAFVGSTTSRASYNLTVSMETLLNGADRLSYECSGDISAGARLLAQTTRYEVTTSALNETLQNFLSNI